MSRSRLRLLGLSTLSILLFVPAAQAEVETSYSFDLVSAYVWRGITFTDGLVFQPSITTSHDSGLSFNVWGNVDIDDANGLGGEFQEVDLTLSYAFPSAGSFGAEIGFIEYLFPNLVGPGTREVYVSLGWDFAVSPSVAIYYDFDEVDDYYAVVGLSHSREIGTDLSLDLAIEVSNVGDDFARAYGGIKGGLYGAIASIGIGYAPGDSWGVSGFVAYADTLDEDHLPDQAVDVFAGVAVSKAF